MASRTIKETQALQGSKAQLNGSCPTSLIGDDNMNLMGGKIRQTSSADDSGIDSPTLDPNSELSEYLSGTITKCLGVSAGSSEEVVTTFQGASKVSGKIKSFLLRVEI